MTGIVRAAAIVIIVSLAAAGCQKKCKTGKPCGNTCISKEYTCTK